MIIMEILENEKPSLLTALFRSVENFGANVGRFITSFTEKANDIFYELSEKVHQFSRHTLNTLWVVTKLYLEMIHLLPFIMVVLAHNAFEKGDKETLDLFLLEFLNMAPSLDKQYESDRIEALWILIKRAPNWLAKYQFDVTDMIKYLAFSINRQITKIKKERFKRDNLDKTIHVLEAVEKYSECTIDPLKIIITNEEIRAIRNFVIKNLSKKKYLLEKKIVELIFKGYSFTDCEEILKCKRSDITTLQRRLIRRMKIVG